MAQREPILSPLRTESVADSLVHRTDYRVGMPQLALNGLSEIWLLSECGDRHWQLLARASGTSSSCWLDAQGRRVYPAFRSVHLRDGNLDTVREDDHLEIVSSLGRVSRTQFFSTHQLLTERGTVGQVQLISAFIARGPEGGNTTATRSQVTGFEYDELSDAGLRLAGDERDWLRLLAQEQAVPVRSLEADELILRPCPSLHFNGAGFLYFARFLELVEQAEWHWFGSEASSVATTQRSIRYFGNADVGTLLAARLRESHCSEGHIYRRTQLRRLGDQHLIADVTTSSVVRAK